MNISTVQPPPQCSARRRPTLREKLWHLLIGTVRGFDPDVETRCTHYAGHSLHLDCPNQIKHRDLAGHEW
jgi:hypothetical protein